ncbi:M28 family metallopeptidase [Glaciecola sp. SC05]|uniref:M28 family metallopeptidase n=1 Tax=Glaciecola sp. SC05 TaxID=1987355 RepID=UPI003527BD78
MHDLQDYDSHGKQSEVVPRDVHVYYCLNHLFCEPQTIMHSIKMAFAAVLFLLCTFNAQAQQAISFDPLTAETETYLKALAGEGGIGVRKAGTESEVQAANFIQSTLESFGYSVERQAFAYVNRDTKVNESSQNIIAHKAGKTDKYIILGAHYDSTSEELGSLGAIDNAASIAVLLSVAKIVSELDTQEYGVKFIAFGAEEVGLVGAFEYVDNMSDVQKQNARGMINLDGIVGSDNLYIHSAHSTPYACKGNAENYRFDGSLRDRLMAVATKVTPANTFKIHPGFEGYPSGETGGWSDHAPFACAGIAIGNFESTNFSINGESGRDGYSQSTHPSLWTCFDEANMGPCDRETEKKWGKIWHTGNDRLDVIESLFPGRVRQQLSHNLGVLRAFFVHLDSNLHDSQK